jgi:lipid-A-disaccharide synthase
VLDAVKKFEPDLDFLNKNGISKEQKIIALLPGSRKAELKRMVPVMAEVAKTNPAYQFIVAAVDTMPGELYAPLKSLSSVKFVFDATYDLLSHADAALVTSGTATLETGLFKVPQVVLYRAGSLEYRLLKRLVKVKYISLINLIADRLVIREMIQDDMNVEQVNAELTKIFNDFTYRSEMLSAYGAIYKVLDTGSASENTARLMVNYLNNKD